MPSSCGVARRRTDTFTESVSNARLKQALSVRQSARHSSSSETPIRAPFLGCSDCWRRACAPVRASWRDHRDQRARAAEIAVGCCARGLRLRRDPGYRGNVAASPDDLHGGIGGSLSLHFSRAMGLCRSETMRYLFGPASGTGAAVERVGVDALMSRVGAPIAALTIWAASVS